MAFDPMSKDSIDEMNRYIQYRMRDEKIPATYDSIGMWMDTHIHELKDKPLIDAYLLSEEGA